jgi:ATP-dependent RNA circularization protein (DNA/RNA ligase family)
VIHKLKNKDALIQTIATNMKHDGYFFIQTFDASDTNSTSTLTVDSARMLLEKYELCVSEGKVFDQYDDEEGHKHWHKILQLTGQRCD